MFGSSLVVHQAGGGIVGRRGDELRSGEGGSLEGVGTARSGIRGLSSGEREPKSRPRGSLVVGGARRQAGEGSPEGLSSNGGRLEGRPNPAPYHCGVDSRKAWVTREWRPRQKKKK
ncbi:hypothetical protein TIFTF001_015575 [Ficus carica]|uniref:Uncharacterized protein n=1 Tax=Ficus carica TaxID=3494 RepID=A0AA88AI02_FICCA|nr:hypothetical protein TIFTF001_015575 [Ficus carica]